MFAKTRAARGSDSRSHTPRIERDLEAEAQGAAGYEVAPYWPVPAFDDATPLPSSVFDAGR
jgi:hypothetical protein